MCDGWGWDVVDMCVMGGGGMWWICECDVVDVCVMGRGGMWWICESVMCGDWNTIIHVGEYRSCI